MASAMQSLPVKVRMNCFSTAPGPSLSQKHRASCCKGRGEPRGSKHWEKGNQLFLLCTQGRGLGLNEAGMPLSHELFWLLLVGWRDQPQSLIKAISPKTSALGEIEKSKADDLGQRQPLKGAGSGVRGALPNSDGLGF